MLSLIESSISSALVNSLHAWQRTVCIHAVHEKKPNEGKAVFHLPVRLNFHLLFAVYLSAKWLSYKLFQVLLMELFLFELLAPGFICLARLSGLRKGGFPISRGVKSQKHIWITRGENGICPNITRRVQSAGYTRNSLQPWEQRLQNHQRKILLTIYMLIPSRSLLGYRL